MITIGIIICDKDYIYIDKLLNQISTRVKVPYEIIIIDNREKYKDIPINAPIAFSFGYNAYQFSARKKIIDLSRGEFIWFVDGDDEVLGLESFNENVDVNIYNYIGSDHESNIKPDVLSHVGVLSPDTFSRLGFALWNKIIRKSLYNNVDEYIDDSLKIVNGEDVIYLLIALVNAKTFECSEEVIYKHNPGPSISYKTCSTDTIRHICIGNKVQFEILKKVLKDNPDLYSSLYNNNAPYLLANYTYIQRRLVDADQQIADLTDILTEVMTKQQFTQGLNSLVIPSLKKPSYYETLLRHLQKAYGYEYGIDKEISCIETYYDEETQTLVDRPVTRIVEQHLLPNETWPYTLSIIMLVYDGNQQYLKTFTEYLNRVQVKYEAIIVDNRDNKDKPLEYIGNPTIVVNKSNLGILEGRRAGFEAATGDYIWFVDIDDEILVVENNNYGDEDILVFPILVDDTLADKTFKHLPPIVKKEDFWTDDIGGRVTVILWNKWIKRELLEKAYEKIPHVDIIYSEDTIVYYSMIEFAENMRILNNLDGIYNHKLSDTSITLNKNTLSKKEQIDILFKGADIVLNYLYDTYGKDHKLLLDNGNIGSVMFYLDIVAKSTDEIFEYALNKIISIFGKDTVLTAILRRGDTRANRKFLKIIFDKYDYTL